MANLNRIILVGRLTADPELRYTVDGTPIAKMGLAVNRDISPGVDFINIIAWRRLAEISSQYLKKGNLAFFEGRIKVRSFYDESGRRRGVTEVVAQKMKMLEKKTAAAEKLSAAEPPLPEPPVPVARELSPVPSEEYGTRASIEDFPPPEEAPPFEEGEPVLEGEDLPF
jgi:single-strand DNA-binding protein